MGRRKLIVPSKLVSLDACRYCGKPPDVEFGDEWIWMCPECDEIKQHFIETHPGAAKHVIGSAIMQELRTRWRIEDVEWLLQFERDADTLAIRVNAGSAETLEKMLRRRGREDLRSRIVWRGAHRRRTEWKRRREAALSA